MSEVTLALLFLSVALSSACLPLVQLFSQCNNKDLPAPAVWHVWDTVKSPHPFTSSDGIDPLSDMEDLYFWKNSVSGKVNEGTWKIYMKCSKSTTQVRNGGTTRVNLYLYRPWLTEDKIKPFLTLSVKKCESQDKPVHSITVLSYDISTLTSQVIIREAGEEGGSSCQVVTIDSNMTPRKEDCPLTVTPNTMNRKESKTWVNNWKEITSSPVPTNAGLFSNGNDIDLPEAAVLQIWDTAKFPHPFTNDEINTFTEMEDSYVWENYVSGKIDRQTWKIYMKCSNSKVSKMTRVNLYLYRPWIPKGKLMSFLTLSVNKCKPQDKPVHSITVLSYDIRTLTSQVIIREARKEGGSSCQLVTINSSNQARKEHCPPTITSNTLKRNKANGWVNNWKDISTDEFYELKKKGPQ